MRVLDFITEFNESAGEHYFFAFEYFNRGDGDKSLEKSRNCVELCLEADATRVDAKSLLLFLTLKLGLTSKFDQLVERFSEHLNESYDYLLHIAMRAIAGGDFDKPFLLAQAAEDLKVSKVKFVEDVLAHGCRFFVGQYLQEILSFGEKLAETNSDSPVVNHIMGHLMEDDGNIHQAIDFYESGLKIDSDNGHLHFELAIIYDTLGNSVLANRHYKDAASNGVMTGEDARGFDWGDYEYMGNAQM
jgi:tetratricopeptide (TPR) repeat protein